MIHAYLCSAFQTMLIYMVVAELMTDSDYNCVMYATDTITLLYVRFICITILHLSMTDQTNKFLTMMKYVCNHSYKFEGPGTAFMMGAIQFLVTSMIEAVNVLVLLCTSSTLDLIGNFVSLVIIAEFDEYVFSSMKDEPFKMLVEREFTDKVFEVQHTTSKKATEKDMSNSVDDEGELRPLKVTFKSRTCSNRAMYITYKVMRAYFISIYFYFLPFTAMLVGTSFVVINRDNIPA